MDREAWILPALMFLCPPPVQSTQQSTRPISVELEPSNTATSHRDDILRVDETGDEATKPPTIVLSEEQANILEEVKRGGNVFFTGSAGTGKTVLLREIIKSLRSTRRCVAVTASTGIASINIGGTTLHSWAGIGLGKDTTKRLCGKVRGTDYLRKRWCSVHSLIIDEISMIGGVLFDKLEKIARTVRGNEKPFGGIQLIVTGDFFQLPPVPDLYDGTPLPSIFTFDAESWSRCIDAPVMLKHVFRQRDQVFVGMLNEMRWGEMSKRTISKLHQLSREIHYQDGIEPTELYPTRSEVVNANDTRLAQIKDNTLEFDAVDCPGFDENHRPVSLRKMARLLNRLVALPTVALKTGAQVMLIKNLEQGCLVNGTTGKVIGFFTRLEAACHGILVAGRGELEDKRLKAVIQCKTWWPLVRFTNRSKRLCVPEEFTVTGTLGNVEASRTQVPLILAWALSVHKSQGQTLERVRVDLRRTFEKGQAYVALSRATNLDTLEVRNFDPLKVMAHPRVIEWYEQPNKEATDSDEYDQYLTDEAYGFSSSQ